MINYLEGKYIYVTQVGLSKTGKTLIFHVRTKEDEPLGTIKWFAQWRKYAFEPNYPTVYEEQCLGDIANFVKTLTYQHYHEIKKKKNPNLAESEEQGTGG